MKYRSSFVLINTLRIWYPGDGKNSEFPRLLDVNGSRGTQCIPGHVTSAHQSIKLMLNSVIN